MKILVIFVLVMASSKYVQIQIGLSVTVCVDTALV